MGIEVLQGNRWKPCHDCGHGWWHAHLLVAGGQIRNNLRPAEQSRKFPAWGVLTLP